MHHQHQHYPSSLTPRRGADMSNSAAVATAASPSSVTVRCPRATADGAAQRQQLYEFYQQGTLTDVELVVQGDVVAVHRVVLAAASPFFHALFTSGMKESRERRIELFELSSAAFRELVAFMYLGELQLSGDTVLAVMHTANQLEMAEVVETCCQQLMLELTVSNCVDIYVCCESLQMRPPCRILAHASLAMIHAFLVDVIRSDAFLNLPLPVLARILLRQNDSPGTEAALAAWVSYDAPTRKHQLAALQDSFEMSKETAGAPSMTGTSMVHPFSTSPHAVSSMNLDYLEACAKSDQPCEKEMKIPVMIAIGGFNGPNALRTAEYLDFHSSEWFPVASMKERRSYSAMATTADDKIIVLGGSCHSRHLKTVEQFDPECNAWETLPPMRKSRSYLGAAYLDGFVYAVGGFNGLAHLATVERYDTCTQRWEELAPLNIGRSGLALVVVSGLVYAIGGYDGRKHLRSVEVFDPQRNEWVVLPNQMRHPRNGPAAVVLQNERGILVFGGECRHGMRMNTCERMQLNTGKWEELDPLLDYRSGHVAISVLRDSFVYCFGGSNKKDEYVDAVHRYDPLNKQWTFHSRMHSQRCGLNVALVHVSRDAACIAHDAKQRPHLRHVHATSTTTTTTGIPSISAFASLSHPAFGF